MCVDGYRLEGSTQPSELERRWLLPVSEQHRFVYLDEEKGLVQAVRQLSRVLGNRVTTQAGERLVQFAGLYGFPVEPEWLPHEYRVSFAAVREELSAFQGFERRWAHVVRQAARKRRPNTAASATAIERERLATDVSKFLDERRVRVIFEAHPDHAGLTLRLFAGAPVTAAVLRIAHQWVSGGTEHGLGMRQCAAPGCPEWFSPKRRNGLYHSDTCRQRAKRARDRADTSSLS